MAGQQRVYRERIRATESLKKIFRAMELIAASRIGKARNHVRASAPSARALTRAISAVATHADVDHPLTSERTDTDRVAVVVVTSDRGMAGAYSANAIREAERLVANRMEAGKEVQLYAVGRRAISYYKFRNRPLSGQWSGDSDRPSVELAHEIADTLLRAFLAKPEDGAVGELHIVFTQFETMVTQTARVIRMLPLEVVEGVEDRGEDDALPLYDFEPTPEAVLDALLPRYVRSRIFECLLQAAASELAARQSAMHTATKNAEDIVRDLTRRANAARQSEITQEISEIVSGADALAART